VIGSLHSRPRAVEFKAFLKRIEGAVPGDLDVHVILDNSSTHKTPAIQKWLTAHPRFVLHFTPTSSSWLNLVERGSAQHRHPRLDRHLEREPAPYVWTKTADQILDSITRYCTRISESGHMRVGCAGPPPLLASDRSTRSLNSRFARRPRRGEKATR
jgi:transposase